MLEGLLLYFEIYNTETETKFGTLKIPTEVFLEHRGLWFSVCLVGVLHDVHRVAWLGHRCKLCGQTVTRMSLPLHVLAVRTGLTLVLITGVLMITQVAVPEFAEELVSGQVFFSRQALRAFIPPPCFLFMQMHLPMEVTVASLVLSLGCGTRRQEALFSLAKAKQNR